MLLLFHARARLRCGNDAGNDQAKTKMTNCPINSHHSTKSANLGDCDSFYSDGSCIDRVVHEGTREIQLMRCVLHSCVVTRRNTFILLWRQRSVAACVLRSQCEGNSVWWTVRLIHMLWQNAAINRQSVFNLCLYSVLFNNAVSTLRFVYQPMISERIRNCYSSVWRCWVWSGFMPFMNVHGDTDLHGGAC
jgi:hypothetical protein